MLRTYLEAVDLYEVVSFRIANAPAADDQYMKNFPFAEARVKREVRDNPAFAMFLNDRNTAELTNRRDMVRKYKSASLTCSLSSCHDQCRDCHEYCSFWKRF